VDGKVVATGKQANSIAFLQVADETFDIGVDTRTGQRVPFAFDGKIDKLTVKLGPMQLSAADELKMREATARARDLEPEQSGSGAGRARRHRPGKQGSRSRPSSHQRKSYSVR
jgi:hypothetical protein